MNKIDKVIKAHKINTEEIIRKIAEREIAIHENDSTKSPQYLERTGIKEYQNYIYAKFGDIIKTPSFDYISKAVDGWLIVGDHRREVAARISLIIEQYGLGIGMIVLHAQQMNSGYIPLSIRIDDKLLDLAQPTERCYGVKGEQILFIPARQFRNKLKNLADLNIAKPEEIWDQSRIVKHVNDTSLCCFYCSAGEINPSEVVISIKGVKFGLSRNYNLGFTFSPFGNPISVVHFLAWDRSDHPYNMNRTPVTVSDLVKLVYQINESITNFFGQTGVKDAPTIDGISNGWAGNSIYHQHFQFFCPEYETPIIRENLVDSTPVLARDDVKIYKLSWPTPVYKIVADDQINVGLVGNDLAGIWRLQGKAVEAKDVQFFDGYKPQEGTKIHNFTQNLYIPGKTLGTTGYIILRQRKKVNYLPLSSDYIDQQRNIKPIGKTNIGVLEATGSMIVDDKDAFNKIVNEKWSSSDVSEQIAKMLKSVCVEDTDIEQFEKNIGGLFPE